MGKSELAEKLLQNKKNGWLTFDEGEVDMGGGMDWEHAFKDGVSLDEGTYIMTSGNRLADGSVPVTAKIFTIKEGQTTTLDLVIRENPGSVSVIGEFNSESPFTPDGATSPVSLLSKTGRGFYVLGVLEVGKEPTNHIMRDLAAKKTELEKWGRPIVLLCSTQAELTRLKEETAAGRYGNLPSTVILGLESGNIKDSIISNMELPNANLPLFIIADTFNKVYFVSQGYTIGLGGRIYETVSKLE